MPPDFAEVIMNPTCQRIVQYLLLHPTGTAREIGRSLSDVPQASLYRHLKRLRETGCVEVVAEKPARGATEKTYALAAQQIADLSTQDASTLIQRSLAEISVSFLAYFQREDADPVADMLTLSAATLMLSDEEFAELFQRFGEVINNYLYNEPTEGRKPRRLTILSSPVEQEDKTT